MNTKYKEGKGKGKRDQHGTRDTYTISRASENETELRRINSTQNTNKKTETLNDVSEKSSRRRKSVEFVSNTPSTIINISPWGDLTPQPTALSDDEKVPRPRNGTPKPKITSLRSFNHVRRKEPNVEHKTEAKPKHQINDEPDESEDQEIDISNAKNMSSWRDNKSMADCNLYMLKNQIDYDVTLLMGKSQEPVLAHSYVLSARSANMESILTDHKDRISKMVAIPNVTAEVFRPILEFFYTDEIELSFQLASSIIPATCIVGSRDLMNSCFRYLLSEMSADNVCIILEHAHKVNVKQVYYRCLQFIYTNAEEVLLSKPFLKLCSDCVEDIVKSDDLNAEELAVFNALTAWADSQNLAKNVVPTDESRREILGELLYHVRFKLIGVDEFTQHISKMEVLQKEEKLALYQAKYNLYTNLPERFEKPPRRIKKQIELGLDNAKSEKHSTTAQSNKSKISEHTSYKHLPIENVIRFDDVRRCKWQMKGPDAICLAVSSSILLRGAQIFGPVDGLEDFKAEITVFDEDKQELSTALVEICPENDKKVYDVLLNDPVKLNANVYYTVQMIIKGRPTHYGVNGKEVVEKTDIRFEFKNSNRSFNGTDVFMGQIPAILYSVNVD
ncbi:PHR domain [Mactra antiquata]